MHFYRRLHPVQAISFDLDDTLYNNIPVMQRAEQAMRDYVAQEFPQTAVWQTADWLAHRQQLLLERPELGSHMTHLRQYSLAAGLRHFGVNEDEIEAGVTAAFNHFMTFRNAIEVPKSVHQALRQLADAYPVIAVSNGNVDVAAIGLAPYFVGVFQPTTERRGKPYLDLFLAAQEALPTVTPAAWLHVGDSPQADILGAHRAGWQSAWFTGGLGRPDQLQILPTLAYNELDQLVAYLLTARG